VTYCYTAWAIFSARVLKSALVKALAGKKPTTCSLISDFIANFSGFALGALTLIFGLYLFAKKA
jgi:hypothetical protein